MKTERRSGLSYARLHKSLHGHYDQDQKSSLLLFIAFIATKNEHTCARN